MILAVAAASIFLQFAVWRGRGAELNEEDRIDIEAGVFADEHRFSIAGIASVAGRFDVAAARVGESAGRREIDEGISGSAESWK